LDYVLQWEWGSRGGACCGLWVACTTLMMLVVAAEQRDPASLFAPVFRFCLFVWLAIVWLNKRLPRPWDWIFCDLFIITLTINGVKIGDCIPSSASARFWRI